MRTGIRSGLVICALIALLVTFTPAQALAVAPVVHVTSTADCEVTVDWDAVNPAPSLYRIGLTTSAGASWFESTGTSSTFTDLSVGRISVQVTLDDYTPVASPVVFDVPQGSSRTCVPTSARVTGIHAAFDWATNVHATWSPAVSLSGEEPVTKYGWCLVGSGMAGQSCGETVAPGTSADVDVSNWTPLPSSFTFTVWAISPVGRGPDPVVAPSVGAFVNSRPPVTIYLNPNRGSLYSVDMQTGSIAGPMFDAFPADGPAAFDVSPDSQTAYFISATSPPRVYTLNMATGHYASSSFALPAQSCRGADLGPDGFLWAACTDSDGWTGLILRINLQTHVVAQISRGGAFLPDGIATDPGTNDLRVFSTWGWNAKVDRQSGAWTNLPSDSAFSNGGAVDYSTEGDRYIWTKGSYRWLAIRDHVTGAEHSLPLSGGITDFTFPGMAVVTAFPTPITNSPSDPRLPDLAPPVSTNTGFTTQIQNFDASWSWTGTASNGGTVTVSPSGLVTVSGLPEGWTQSVTVTSARAGYLSGSASVSGTSLVLNAELMPSFGPAMSTEHGFSIHVVNYDSAWAWSVDASDGGSATIDGTGEIRVTGLAAAASAVVTVTTNRLGYRDGAASVSGTAGASATPTSSPNPTSAVDGPSWPPVAHPGATATVTVPIPVLPDSPTAQPTSPSTIPVNTSTNNSVALSILTPSQLVTLMPAVMRRLAASVIAGLSPRQVSQLPTRALAAMKPSQFRALSPSQVSAMTARQIAALPAEVFAQANRAVLGALSPGSARGLRLAQIAAIPSDVVWGISRSAYARMTWAQQQAMKRASRMIR